jgi:hypothetical protein
MLAGSDSTSTIKPLWVQALVASAEPMIQEARAAQTLRTGMDLDAFLEAVPVALCLEDWRENQIICLNARALHFGAKPWLASALAWRLPPGGFTHSTARHIRVCATRSWRRRAAAKQRPPYGCATPPVNGAGCPAG